MIFQINRNDKRDSKVNAVSTYVSLRVTNAKIISCSSNERGGRAPIWTGIKLTRHSTHQLQIPHHDLRLHVKALQLIIREAHPSVPKTRRRMCLCTYHPTASSLVYIVQQLYFLVTFYIIWLQKSGHFIILFFRIYLFEKITHSTYVISNSWFKNQTVSRKRKKTYTCVFVRSIISNRKLSNLFTYRV